MTWPWAVGLDLGLGEVACAYDEARAAGELQKDWEQIHGRLVDPFVDSAGSSGVYRRVLAGAPTWVFMCKVFKLNTLGSDLCCKVLHLRGLDAKYSIQTGYCRILSCPVFVSFLWFC